MPVSLTTVAEAPLIWWSGQRITDPGWLVLTGIRAPRVVLGLVVGASLGVSGAMMQGLFRNPLASPTLIGVANGAALGAAVAIVGLGHLPTLPLLAFVGAALATLSVLRLGSRDGVAHTASLLLAGIAVNAICGAGTGLLVYLADESELRTLTFFTLGSLGGATWGSLKLWVPLALLPVALVPWVVQPLDALLLGEAEARHLGVPVERTKRVLIGLCCVGVGTCVAASGVIGFVGLAVPHLVRLVGGPRHGVVLPGSALCGAALLVAADTLSRVVVAPAELPIGILTTLLGGPFFLVLLGRALERG
ncbi:MAG: iron ABC transporter permease [Alphaproteobacteria bacterium]|nr:iron ABC transporter permease [Alphaproteobacteria bacterium]MCB9692271.1 iron ABC transporter permease [Alphaproteobacteria bacterium]